MQGLPLALLAALDALLTTNSVGQAAARVGVTPSAMSRSLGRLRRVLDDPLLAPAGRRLVPTPRALALRGEVRTLIERAERVLRPERALDVARLSRTFTIQTNDYGVAVLGARLSSALAHEAPHVVLRFRAEGPGDLAALQDGDADLDFGHFGTAATELKVQTLFRERFVVLARRSHPLLAGRMNLARFCAAQHITISRDAKTHVLIDRVLARRKLTRNVSRAVPFAMAAIWLCADSDLVTLVPKRLAELAAQKLPVAYCAPPLRLPDLPIAQGWHPRFDADPAHRWLRQRVHALCSER